MNKFYKWLRKSFNKTRSSIAFYPALISIGFLLLSVLMLELDFSEAGKHIKSQLSWISLRDASTARTILGTVAGGIISLTVFSFSMVMILLSQVASQLSNRMLDSMIGNRFQQIILGFYIGTIVFALFLLSTIRDITSGIYVPALSIYLLLVLTVVDLFLFIYFLHYVTQSVKFGTIIERIHKNTFHTLYRICITGKPKFFELPELAPQIIYTASSDYYQGCNANELLKFAGTHNGLIQFLHPPGTFLLKGTPLLHFYSSVKLSRKDVQEMMETIDFYTGQPIHVNAYYGYHQLAEVAIKALSPGINDPETAVISLHALTDLFLYRLHHFIKTVFVDEEGLPRINTVEYSFERLFAECYYPIWDYGKKDRYIQDALQQMLEQLRGCDIDGTQSSLFTAFLKKIKSQKAKDEFRAINREQNLG
ncbi:MAG: DUF2254 domain-containing protein [Ferruginibacter sp.]